MCRRMYLKVRLAVCVAQEEVQGHRLKILTSQVILFSSLQTPDMCGILVAKYEYLQNYCEVKVYFLDVNMKFLEIQYTSF
jgi:hypothetical protein